MQIFFIVRKTATDRTSNNETHNYIFLIFTYKRLFQKTSIDHFTVSGSSREVET